MCGMQSDAARHHIKGNKKKTDTIKPLVLRGNALYQEFLQTVDASAIIDEAYELIAPYVEKDPTAFCTYGEFEAGVAALKVFCHLRSESAMGQLAGEIPSTEEEKQADSSTLIDTGNLNLSDMGTMSTGGDRDNKPGDLAKYSHQP